MKPFRKQSGFRKILIALLCLVAANIFLYGLWKFPQATLLCAVVGVVIVIAIAWRRLYLKTNHGKVRRQINFGGLWVYKLLRAVGALAFMILLAATIIFFFQYNLGKYLFWAILAEIVVGCIVVMVVRRKFRIIEFVDDNKEDK